MSKSATTKLSALLAAAVVVTTLSTGCSTKTEAAAEITERQDMMKNWKDASAIMGEEFEISTSTISDKAYTKIKEQAAYLNQTADEPWALFSNPENKGKATEAVWSEVEDWETSIDSYKTKTAELEELLSTKPEKADLGAALVALKDSCGSCHDKFKGK